MMITVASAVGWLTSLWLALVGLVGTHLPHRTRPSHRRWVRIRVPWRNRTPAGLEEAAWRMLSELDRASRFDFGLAVFKRADDRIVRMTRGRPIAAIRRGDSLRADPLVAQAMRSDGGLVIADLDRFARRASLSAWRNVGWWVGLPIRFGGQVVGVVVLLRQADLRELPPLPDPFRRPQCALATAPQTA
jgi:hypothetical protein